MLYLANKFVLSIIIIIIIIIVISLAAESPPVEFGPETALSTVEQPKTL